jgi:4-hydroxy-4-methyl-2-oxoglutarate aldolase
MSSDEQHRFYEARDVSTATLHEAAEQTGALPSFLRPLAPHMKIWGRAYTVKCPAGDNLWLHHGLAAAAPGDVLVADCGDGFEFGYWGEIMTVAAIERKLGGLIITGGVRDAQRLADLGFPIFSGRVCFQGTRKDPTAGGSLGAPIHIGATTIHSGDLMVGDFDGVMAIPSNEADGVINAAATRDDEEVNILRRLRSGASTLEIYQLPRIPEQTRATF